MNFDVAEAPLHRGITLIEASAGTGKTYSIAALFLRFVLEEQLPVQRILAVTYTKAATQELRERIRARLRDGAAQLRVAQAKETKGTKEIRETQETQETGKHDHSADPVIARYLSGGGNVPQAIRRLEQAVQLFDEAPIFTIHGFSQRALQDHAFESGARYAATTLADATPLYEEVAGDFWRRAFHRATPFLAALAVTSTPSEGVSPAGWAALLQQTASHPELLVVPPRSGKPAAALASEAETALRAVVARWSGDRDEVEAILGDKKRISQNESEGYGRKRRARFFAAMDALASAWEDGMVPESFDAVTALSRSRIAGAVLRNGTVPEHPFFEACEAFVQAVRRLFIELNHEFLDYAREELARRKAQRNVFTFDDLLTRLDAALGGPGGEALAGSLRGKYDVALIDEFQDTDPLQAGIFQRLFADIAAGEARTRDGGRPWLFYIGDPKQAIYGFRGADVFAYLKAADAAAHRYSLAVNWRSDARLLEGFNRLFQQVENPFILDKIQYVEVQAPPGKLERSTRPPLEFRHLASEDSGGVAKGVAEGAIAEALALDVERLRDGEGFRPGEMAVLVRAARQARLVQDALRRHGIPAVLNTDESVFSTPEAELMQQFLDAVAEPRHAGRIKVALASPLFGCDAGMLGAFETSGTGGDLWTEKFAAWRSLWEGEGFTAMFRRVMTEERVRRRLMERPAGERRLTNLLHLAELLHHEETTRRLGPEALCGWLREERGSPRTDQEAAQLRLESDAEAVSIVTIHRSKGLEYPAVFCPFLWQEAESPRRKTLCFHDAEGRITLDLRGKDGGDPADVAKAAEQVLAEEVRLLYVALTRARHRCVVYTADYKKGEASPLARLFPRREVLAGIRSLAERHPEAIALNPLRAFDLSGSLDEEEPTNIERTIAPTGDSAPTEAAPRFFRGSLSRIAFTTSFTGLTRGTAGEEPERDEPQAEPAENPSGNTMESPRGLPAEKPQPVHGIHLFDKGARAGDFFHDVLEHLDFTDPKGLDTLVPAKLALHGFANTPLAEAIGEKLREVLEVELEPGLTLAQVRLTERISEADFSCRLPSLRVGDLRAAFADECIPELDLAALENLRFAPVKGFLRGAIDLFFRHRGRYYLLDWKSNWLGPAPENYDPAGVTKAMREHHYALQAHLYVLAADCYLRARLPGYDYARHFGGVFYVFLRGVERGNPERGLCRLRPGEALVQRLRTLVEGPR